MKTRIITAAIGIPIVLFIVHLGGPLLFAMALAMALMAAREVDLATHSTYGRSLRVDGLLLYPAVVWIMMRQWHWPGDALMLWFVPGAMLLLAVLAYNQPWRPSLGSVALSLLAAMYVGLFAFIPMLRHCEPHGALLMWLLLGGVWMGDTMAYFIGRAIGKHKLTALSPGKTVEGFLGGLGAAVITCLLIGAGPLGVYHSLVLGLLIGIATPLGDLIESYWKRELGVKDLGRILPGHGGILDRCDSLIFTAWVVYCYAELYLKNSG